MLLFVSFPFIITLFLSFNKFFFWDYKIIQFNIMMFRLDCMALLDSWPYLKLQVLMDQEKSLPCWELEIINL